LAQQTKTKNMEAPNIKLTLDSGTDVLCKNCQNKTFKEVFMLKKFSKLLTGESDDKLLPITVLTCTNCNTILEDTLPKTIKA
jgi:hypothetical protein